MATRHKHLKLGNFPRINVNKHTTSLLDDSLSSSQFFLFFAEDLFVADDDWFEEAAAAVALRLGSPRSTRVDFKSTISSARANRSLNLKYNANGNLNIE